MGMVSLDACIYTIIAVLGVAYPILLQVISRLDDKYSSARAVGLFEEELPKKLFVYSLVASVVAVFIWFCKLAPPTGLVPDDGLLANTIENSALLLVHLATVLLLVFFFWLTDKTLTYYNTQKFVAYLQRKHHQNRKDERHVEILTDVFIAVLAAKNSPVLLPIIDFFSEEFRREQAEAGSQEVIYSPVYYELTHRSTEELARLGNRKNKGITYYAAGGGWLLGGHLPHRISEATYTAIWRNLLLALEYGQDDMLYEYWRTAYQHLDYALPPIQQEFDPTDAVFRVTNAEAIALRVQERERFLEFHQAMGAVLLYAGKAELLRRLWRYTTSQPPHYWLLPSYMTEIFASFVRYRSAFTLRAPVDLLYPFPNEAGVGSEGLISKWLSLYLAALFLRQYTLQPYLIGDEPLAYPLLPADQSEKQEWLQSLAYFRRLVVQVLHDPQLLRDLGLEFITETWCREQHVPYPVVFIDSLERQLTAAYQRDANRLPLAPEKVAEFDKDSGRLLEQAADEVMQLALAASSSDGSPSLEPAQFLRGRHQLVDKDAYAVRSVVADLTFSTALASRMRQDLRQGVAALFIQRQTKSYRLAPHELFAALDQLGLDSRYLVINLGINLHRIASDGGVEGFSADTYKGTEIVTFRANFVTASLLVIRRQDLPQLTFLPPDPLIEHKYQLRRISDRFHLYGSVLDTNEASPEVEVELRNGDFGDFADDKVASLALEVLALLLEFRWQNNAQLIQLISYETAASASPFPSDLPSVTSLSAE
jgi:hypothetical protein